MIKLFAVGTNSTMVTTSSLGTYSLSFALAYRVVLPDHDWVVATRYRLIPSLYASCLIDDKKGRENKFEIVET